MINTVSFTMVDESDERDWHWLDQPNRLAGELYPFDKEAAELASIKIYGDLEGLTFGQDLWPPHLDRDQLEDWLAMRAVKTVIYAQDMKGRLRG